MLCNSAMNIWAITNPGRDKTLCFAIAMLSRIETTENHTQALCLVDSNEVVMQTVGFMTKLSKFTSIKIGSVQRKNGGT